MSSTVSHPLIRRPPRFAAIVVALCLGVAGLAQQKRAPLKPVETTKDDKWEDWRDTVPVSGNVRAGIMAESPGRFDPASRSFVVFLPTVRPPETLPRFVCVDVSGKDGRYTATRAYNIRGRSAGPLDLELPTSYSPQIAKYPPGQLAILARLADTCDAPAKSYLVAAWSGQSPGSSILVFLNSRLPTTIVAGTGGRMEHEVRCADLPEPTTTFNLQCDIPVAWLESSPPKDIFVRTRRGPSFNTLPLTITLR